MHSGNNFLIKAAWNDRADMLLFNSRRLHLLTFFLGKTNQSVAKAWKCRHSTLLPWCWPSYLVGEMTVPAHVVLLWRIIHQHFTLAFPEHGPPLVAGVLVCLVVGGKVAWMPAEWEPTVRVCVCECVSASWTDRGDAPWTRTRAPHFVSAAAKIPPVPYFFFLFFFSCSFLRDNSSLFIHVRARSCEGPAFNTFSLLLLLSWRAPFRQSLDWSAFGWVFLFCFCYAESTTWTPQSRSSPVPFSPDPSCHDGEKGKEEVSPFSSPPGATTSHSILLWNGWGRWRRILAEVLRTPPRGEWGESK